MPYQLNLPPRRVPAIDEICENTQVPDVRAKGLGLKYQLKSFNFFQ